MEFEFDPAKSCSNAAKHGIDFDEAQQLWRDPDLLRVPARTDDEPRFIVVGMIGAKYWAAVCVERGTATRIISVRRARDAEIRRYEGLL